MAKIEDDEASIEQCLRVGAGFTRSEHADIVERLAPLDARLKTFAAASTDLELSVKDRDRPGQATTLECWIAGFPHVVATSAEADRDRALIEVRDDLRRQLDDEKTRREPQNRRTGHAKPGSD